MFYVTHVLKSESEIGHKSENKVLQCSHSNESLPFKPTAVSLHDFKQKL